METVVSDKFETMVKLGVFNSRMKDFYDVYIILKGSNLDKETLKTAIAKTFENRKTILSKPVVVFEEKFYKDANRQIQWAAFLRKSAITNIKMTFEEIVLEIKKILGPLV